MSQNNKTAAVCTFGHSVFPEVAYLFSRPWTAREPVSDIPALSQLSLSSQWRPFSSNTFPSLNSQASACVFIRWTCPGLSYSQSCLRRGVGWACGGGWGGFQFSKWHDVPPEKWSEVCVRLRQRQREKGSAVPQWSSPLTFHSLYCSLPAFLLFWSGKHMRDSNLHFNYIAQVIRCYLALVIECALRQPSTTVKQPRESHRLSVCARVRACVSSIYPCLSLRVCVSACVWVCVKESRRERWRNSRPTERHTLGTVSIYQYNTCICQQGTVFNLSLSLHRFLSLCLIWFALSRPRRNKTPNLVRRLSSEKKKSRWLPAEGYYRQVSGLCPKHSCFSSLLSSCLVIYCKNNVNLAVRVQFKIKFNHRVFVFRSQHCCIL